MPRMKITRQNVADKLWEYLHHDLSLGQLVDWAEKVMDEGEFDDENFDAIRRATDVRAFGFTWEDCEALLNVWADSVGVDVVSA